MQSMYGISILISLQDDEQNLDALLNSFFQTNSHTSFEILIIESESRKSTRRISSKYATKGFIRHLSFAKTTSLYLSYNYAASQATHPNLLFMDSGIVYTSDVIPLALSTLADSKIGAVGVNLVDAQPTGKSANILHSGIQFAWDEKHDSFQPHCIREQKTKNIFPALSGTFLVCRNEDFQSLNGFSTAFNNGFGDIDFCLRLHRELHKQCFCINTMSLQISTSKSILESSEKHQELFKKTWSEYISSFVMHTSTVNPGRERQIQGEDRTFENNKSQSPVSASLPGSPNPALTQKSLHTHAPQGKILPNIKSETILRGWLCLPDASMNPTAIVQIDDHFSTEVQGNIPCADVAHTESGYFGFELIVPLKFTDGKTHHVKLLDKRSRVVLDEARQTWRISRAFKDFSGFLSHSVTMPLLLSPFREEDKRCFGVMENIADDLASASEAMSNAPMVSIILPVFNSAKTLETTLQTALDQSYAHTEIIIIDDFSTDATRDLLRKMCSSKIKIYQNKKHYGKSHCLNRAINTANGMYIANLDDSTVWDKRYIAAMVGAFQKLPDADAVYCGQYLQRSQSLKPFAVRFGALNKSLLANKNYIEHGSFIYKKYCFEHLGKYSDLISPYAEWDFILRACEDFTIYSIPSILTKLYSDTIATFGSRETLDVSQTKIVHEKRKTRLRNRLKNKNNNYSPKRKVSIIIPSFESLVDLTECIDTILAFKISDWTEIIVVDNGSGKPVIEYLTKLEKENHITLVANTVNFGFSLAINQGLSASWPGRDILILNNDALLTSGSVEILQTTAHEFPECAVVVPQQVLYGGTKTLDIHVPYVNPEYECDVTPSAHHDNIINVPVFHSGKILELSFAPFFCAYIKREVIDRTQGLDAEHGRHYRSDRIFCDIVRHIFKLKILQTTSAIVYHKLQKSTDVLRTSPAKQSHVDMMLNKNKWEPDLAAQLNFKTPDWDI
ncbi:glycosyltransferase [Desulfolutivibrio sulfoxidireducens]|uniref:glycosyltransferase n=1 Tax=Desulfolutivibrio sulfoxidireducens TaxID=2773299 RepID=UPI00159D1E72|nr:glycosyltransferase [Desulfolutivibrio sulfoxidireducens]QLA18488.1 glycosyltransferase [Desulfolutivibrio sulfoxidireducens]